jgi:post-segregation antitoxin (ccd killing protein)
MSELAQKDHGRRRVALGAFVDVEQRRQLVELAKAEDRSVSAVVRRALAAELERHDERVTPR